MSIEIKNPNPNKPEIVYPVARRSRANGAVILFTDLTTGVCIQRGTSTIDLGEKRVALVMADDMNYWEKVEVTIKG